MSADVSIVGVRAAVRVRVLVDRHVVFAAALIVRFERDEFRRVAGS